MGVRSCMKIQEDKNMFKVISSSFSIQYIHIFSYFVVGTDLEMNLISNSVFISNNWLHWKSFQMGGWMLIACSSSQWSFHFVLFCF